MVTKFFLRTLIVLGLFSGSLAQAEDGFLIEPGLGFGFGGQESGDGKWSGGLLDVRLGYQMSTYQFGLDLLHHNAKFNWEDIEDEEEFSLRELGVFFGMNFNETWGGSVTLVLGGKVESDDDIILTNGSANIGTAEADKLTGIKVGVSATVHEHIKLNLEYKNLNAEGEYELVTTEEFKPNIRMLVFTVSFPIVL